MSSEPKKKGGRPVKPADQVLVQKSIRMLRSQWATYDAAGGIEWLRGLVDAGDIEWLRDLVDKANAKRPPGKG